MVVVLPVSPLTSAVFSDVTQPRLVVGYRHFGTCDWSHLPKSIYQSLTHGAYVSRNIGNYQPKLCNGPEERRPQLQRNGSLKSKISRAPKMLDVTSIITRVIKVDLLIGNVYPVTERSLSRYLCRAVSMAWSISVRCGGFHANICIYVVFPNKPKKNRDSLLSSDSIEICYNLR